MGHVTKGGGGGESVYDTERCIFCPRYIFKWRDISWSEGVTSPMFFCVGQVAGSNYSSTIESSTAAVLKVQSIRWGSYSRAR